MQFPAVSSSSSSIISHSSELNQDSDDQPFDITSSLASNLASAENIRARIFDLEDVREGERVDAPRGMKRTWKNFGIKVGLALATPVLVAAGILFLILAVAALAAVAFTALTALVIFSPILAVGYGICLIHDRFKSTE